MRGQATIRGSTKSWSAICPTRSSDKQAEQARVRKRVEPLIYQGLNFIPALPVLRLDALRVVLRYNAGVWTGACGLWQRNGDAEYDGFLRITCCGGRGYGEGTTVLELDGHKERDREGSFVGLLCQSEP